MAILMRCPSCRSEQKLVKNEAVKGKKKMEPICSRCGGNIPFRGRVYKVTVKHNGKKRTKTVDNLDLARKIESTLKHEIIHGTFDIPTNKAVPTLSEFWADYLPWIMAKKKGWRTDKYYFEKHLEPPLGKKRLDAISQLDIERIISNMRKSKSKRGTPYADQTIKHQIILLTRIFNIAMKWGKYSGSNPAKMVDRPKINNQRNKGLSHGDLNRLFQVLDEWPNRMTACFILFLIHTGLRRGELFRLTFSDVDQTGEVLKYFDKENQRWVLVPSVRLRDPKGGEDTVLPLSEKALEVLQDVPRGFDTPYIFYGQKGGQRTDFQAPWQRIKKAANLPADFRLHDLRHHFASTLVSAGVNLFTVQTLLTHKSSAMTMRYAHLSNQALNDAVRLSDGLLTVTSNNNDGAEKKAVNDERN